MNLFKRILGGDDAGNHRAHPGPPKHALDTSGLASRLKGAPPPYVLDMREPYEYADGHIAGAKLIPLGELARRLGELPRDREIVCVCRSGNRSGAAARHLLSAGYNAVNLSGGMLGWQHAGLPMQREGRR